MKQSYFAAIACAIALTACGQQQQPAVQRAVTTMTAPAPAEAAVPPQASDAKTGTQK